jgi:hypothetical protein
MLDYPRMSLAVPGTFEVVSKDGRFAGNFAQGYFKHAEAAVDRLQALEPDAGWTWKRIPVEAETGQ